MRICSSFIFMNSVGADERICQASLHRGSLEVGHWWNTEAHLGIRLASRPACPVSRTSSPPGACGPAPGPSGLWPPGPDMARPREPSRQCRTCSAAEPIESSSPPRRRSFWARQKSEMTRGRWGKRSLARGSGAPQWLTPSARMSAGKWWLVGV